MADPDFAERLKRANAYTEYVFTRFPDMRPNWGQSSILPNGNLDEGFYTEAERRKKEFYTPAPVDQLEAARLKAGFTPTEFRGMLKGEQVPEGVYPAWSAEEQIETLVDPFGQATFDRMARIGGLSATIGDFMSRGLTDKPDTSVPTTVPQEGQLWGQRWGDAFSRAGVGSAEFLGAYDDLPFTSFAPGKYLPGYETAQTRYPDEMTGWERVLAQAGDIFEPVEELVKPVKGAINVYGSDLPSWVPGRQLFQDPSVKRRYEELAASGEVEASPWAFGPGKEFNKYLRELALAQDIAEEQGEIPLAQGIASSVLAEALLPTKLGGMIGSVRRAPSLDPRMNPSLLKRTDDFEPILRGGPEPIPYSPLWGAPGLLKQTALGRLGQDPTLMKIAGQSEKPLALTRALAPLEQAIDSAKHWIMPKIGKEAEVPQADTPPVSTQPIDPTQIATHPFQELANAQRGVPPGSGTSLVGQAQPGSPEYLGGGSGGGLGKPGGIPRVASGIRAYHSEHIGDIIQRMSSLTDKDASIALGWGRNEVGKKAEGAIRNIENPYVSIREVIDKQIRSNAKNEGISFEVAKRQIDDHGKEYADAYRKLPTYNQAHRDAQEAAIAWGEQRYEDALAALKRIEPKTHDEEIYKNYILEGYDEAVTPLVDPTQVARRAPDESARIVPQRTEVFSLLPSRVRDSILLVRAAVNQGIETYRRVGPRQREIGGIPEREIPTDWRARMQRDETGLSTPESIDDVKLEIAIEAEADRVGDLIIEMRKRGVELTDEVRGEIEASQKALYQAVATGVPDSRSDTLLFDAIARRHGGKSISELDDILGDVAPSETGGQLDLNRLHADWDTMGQPEEGIAASRDAARAMDEVESLLHGSDDPTQVARRAPDVLDPPTTRTVDETVDPTRPIDRISKGLPDVLSPDQAAKNQWLNTDIGRRYLDLRDYKREVHFHGSMKMYDPESAKQLDMLDREYMKQGVTPEEIKKLNKEDLKLLDEELNQTKPAEVREFRSEFVENNPREDALAGKLVGQPGYEQALTLWRVTVENAVENFIKDSGFFHAKYTRGPKKGEINLKRYDNTKELEELRRAQEFQLDPILEDPPQFKSWKDSRTTPDPTRTVGDPPYDTPYPVAGGLDEILETGEVGKIITDANPAMKRLMRDKFKKLIGDEYATSRQRGRALGYLRKKTGLSTPELNKIVYNARKALLELAEDSELIKPGGLPGWVRPGHIEEDIYQAQTALGEILRSTLSREKVSEGVFRRYEGILNNLTQTARITAIEGKEKLKQGYREPGTNIWHRPAGREINGRWRPNNEEAVAKLDDLYKALHGEGGAVDPVFTEVFDDIKQLTKEEELLSGMDGGSIQDYFFRGWKAPEGVGKQTKTSGGRLGLTPGFKRPRNKLSYSEMRELGFEPLSWDPYEMWEIRKLQRVRDDTQNELIKTLKMINPDSVVKGVVDPTKLERLQALIPGSKKFRMPKVGPAFEGHYYWKDGEFHKAPGYMVPTKVADVLENLFGKEPEIPIFGKDIYPKIKWITFIPKRAKLVGSQFQMKDFIFREMGGSFAAALDNLSRGKELAAGNNIYKVPQAATDVVHSYMNPAKRMQLRKWYLSEKSLVEGRKLSPADLVRAGLSYIDPTILPPDAGNTSRRLAEEYGLLTNVKTMRWVSEIERATREGLFNGVYPAAIKADVENNILPMILQQYPNATDQQIAGLVAKAANIRYSTIPASQSVITSRVWRNILTHLFFSLGENEGLIRQNTQMFRGPMKSFWIKSQVGTYLSMALTAEIIHFVSTGEHLPAYRFNPIDMDSEDTVFGIDRPRFQRDTLQPDLPSFLSGRNKTTLGIDVLGQQDTFLKLLDPARWIRSRVSAPVNAILNQGVIEPFSRALPSSVKEQIPSEFGMQARTFSGYPLDSSDNILQQLSERTAQALYDLAVPIGLGTSAVELARSKFDPEGKIVKPEAAELGTTGQLLGAGTLGFFGRLQGQPKIGRDSIEAEMMRNTKKALMSGLIPPDQDLMDDLDRVLSSDLPRLTDMNMENKTAVMSLPGNQNYVAELGERGIERERKVVEPGSPSDFFKRVSAIDEEFQTKINFIVDDLQGGGLSPNSDAFFQAYNSVAQKEWKKAREEANLLWDKASEFGVDRGELTNRDEVINAILYTDNPDAYEIVFGISPEEDSRFVPIHEKYPGDGRDEKTWRASEFNRRLKQANLKFGEETVRRKQLAKIQEREDQGILSSLEAQRQRDRLIINEHYRPIALNEGLRQLVRESEEVKALWRQYVDGDLSQREIMDNNPEFSQLYRVPIGQRRRTFKQIYDSQQVSAARKRARQKTVKDHAGRAIKLDRLLVKWEGKAEVGFQGLMRQSDTDRLRTMGIPY